MHASGPKDGARMRVAVDGLLAGYISIPKAASMAAYSVPMPKLTPGNHTVVVRKVSEDNSQKSAKGVLGFGGIEITGGNSKLFSFGARPEPALRRIEFIGDSDTAGWCADGSPSTGDNADKYEDAYQTWAQQIARNVSADVMVEAVSGYGVTKSSSPIQAVLDNTLGFDNSLAWDYTKWVPDAVVILIGPNDEESILSSSSSSSNKTAPELKSSKFIAAYLQLLDMVATNYKAAPTKPKIVHVCGGSLNGLDPCSDIQAANRQFNDKSSTNHGLTGYFTTITTEHWDLINGKGHGSGKTPNNGCDGPYPTPIFPPRLTHTAAGVFQRSFYCNNNTEVVMIHSDEYVYVDLRARTLIG